MPWIDANGVSLHYECTGSGPSLVLLHEIGGSLESWDDIVPTLASRFRVLRYDQRGAGLSEKIRAPFTLGNLIDDLAALLEALDLPAPFHLVGSALGAAQAVGFAAGYPSHVATLALLNPALSVDESRAVFMKERADKAAAEGIRAVLDMTLERAYPPAARQDMEAYRRYRGRYLGNDPHSFALMNRALTNVMDLVSRVQAPTLVIAGEHDAVRPPELVRQTAGLIADSLVRVLDAAHFTAVQAPQALLRELSAFYDGQQAAASSLTRISGSNPS